MKSKRLLLMLLIALIAPWAANAQVTIGTGTNTQNMSPVANFYNYSFTEMIYTASEIAAGTPSGDYILNVGFQLASNGLNGKTYSISVYMKNVDIDQFESAAFTAVSADDLVYEGTMSATAAGWVTLDLQNPFPYDNTKNLLIAINKTAGSYAGSTYNWYYTSTSNASLYQNLYKQNDGSAYSISSLPTDPTRNYNRPNVQLTFGDMPTCFKTSAITVTNVTTTGATLSWTPSVNGTETAWVLQYGTDENFAAGSYIETTVRTPSATLSSLTTESIYYARVKPECDTDGLLWSDVASFWPTATVEVVVNDGTTTNSYIPFYGYYVNKTPNGSQFIIPVATLENINPGSTIKRMTFNGSTTSNSNFGTATFNVYLKEVDITSFASSSDMLDWASLTNVYHGSLTYSNQQMEIIFDNDFVYNGGNLLIGFNIDQTASSTGTSVYFYGVNGSGNSSAYSYMGYSSVTSNVSTFMPKVTFRLIQAEVTCDKPKNLAASNITHNQATITWTSDESAWNIAWSTDPDFDPQTQGSHENNYNQKTYTITGLNPLTDYYVAVQSNCGGDWSNKLHFKTTAEAVVVGDSWSDDFEGTSCGWELINGTLTNQWVWGTAVNNGGTHALYISNDGGNSNTYSADNTKVFAAKLLNFTEGKFIFSYDWRCKGESSWDFLRVALVPASQTLTAGTDYSTITQPSLPTGWIALDGGKLNLQETWQSVELAVNVPAGNYYLVLAWRNDTGVYDPPAAVDNVSVTRMACPYDVTDLAVSNITTNGATLTWTAGEAEEWQVATKTGTGEWTILPNTYTTASATLTSLTAATNYQVRVRAYCNATDQGTWCDPITFTTECEAIDLANEDYTENFDSYTTTTGFLPVCWSRINEGTSYTNYPYVSNSSVNAHSASNYLYFYTYGTSGSDQYAILPEMENMEGKQITLWAKGYNAGNTFKIGMMTDPADATTFEEIAEQTLTTSYEEYSFILGRGNYVAIMMETPTSSTTKGVYIDDITIADVPTCVKPTDLVFVSATTTTATLSWTNGADTQTAWQIAYSTDPAFNPDEVTPVDVTTNPGTISGLTAATIYYAYVRANCGNNGYSDWSNAYCMFTTECEAITNLPWSENFDAYTGSTSTYVPTGYPNDQLPTCWQFLNRSENSSTYPMVFISSNSGYPVSGNCLFFKSSSSTPMYAILPEFTEDIANLQLTFTYRNEGVSASNGTLIVGYMTDPTDATTFIAKHTCEQTTTLTEQEVLFTDAPARSYIAFMYQGGSANNYYLSIDNVSVNYPPTCAKPSNLEFVSSTTTSATLKWTAGGDETAWQIAYSTDPAFDPNEVTPTNVTSNPGTINGLTGSTNYYAYVRANCGNNDYSDWSNACMFATQCDVIVVDATHPFTEGFEGGVLSPCWDQDGDGTWSVGTGDGDTYSSPVGAHTGSYNAKITHNTSGNVTKLITPVLDLTSLNHPALTFWYINRNWGNDTDAFAVYYRTASDAAWTLIEATEETHTEWTKAVYLLPNPSATYQIAFEMTDDYGYGVGIDDVMVLEAFTKEIASYGTSANGGYYLIASPLADAVAPTTVGGMITDEYGTDVTPATSTYDLYSFDQDEALEWVNYRVSPFNLVNGQGYLYASKNGTTLTFIGEPYSGATKEVNIYKSEENSGDFPGWNLVGNPFAEDAAYINRPFYKMDDDGARFLAQEATSPIQPMEGAFVVATQNVEQITFTKAPNLGKANIVLNLSQGRGNTIDRAIISAGQGQTLPKFMLNPYDTKMYIPQNGEDYAVVRSRVSDEIPVSFVPAENGFYNISVDVKNMNLRSLVLKDKVRNVSIDLLRTPTYQFQARVGDRADRFMLSFKISNSIFKEKIVKGANSEDFGFYSYGNWIIDNEGEATLQVIDLNGRVLSTENIYGSTSIQVDAAPGIYMLRLVNGDNVKVQKVVVK